MNFCTYYFFKVCTNPHNTDVKKIFFNIKNEISALKNFLYTAYKIFMKWGTHSTNNAIHIFTKNKNFIFAFLINKLLLKHF
jgi:hypothetical protein